ncbi:hypothetical protein B0T16DRAFT_397128 [Cercophora newfieldiana]|uniref:Uncharacterized protein n=1 Tax=Cercophora newfieldiana TaxID=92897 RepID=A0AA40D071_9PEZI|nr:hypothetical protein B0T16DRAFT_397128 [Cercophora newfieldiana]
MTLMWLALLVAIVPTAYFNWDERNEATAAAASSNARCFFDMNVARKLFIRNNPPGHPGYGVKIEDKPGFRSAFVSFILLSLGYVTQAVGMVKTWSDSARLRVRQPMSRFFLSTLKYIHGWNSTSASSPRTELWVDCLVVKPMITLYLVAKLYTELLISRLSDLYLLFLAVVWGAQRKRAERPVG